jgi:hypothetical protein
MKQLSPMYTSRWQLFTQSCVKIAAPNATAVYLPIGLVELGAARNYGAFANFHFPDPNEELATKRPDNGKR